MKSIILSVLAATALPAPATTVSPAEHAEHDMFVRFELVIPSGMNKGNIYLNRDGSYLIAQTAPDRETKAYRGRWTSEGATGFCIHPEEGAQGECLPRLPAQPQRSEMITSDRGRNYKVMLVVGR